MFYTNLGGAAGTSIGSNHNSNLSLFINLQNAVYWSSTEYAPLPSHAWFFPFYDGYQNANPKDSYDYAWAVRSGDVATVPLPGGLVLLVSALAGMGLFRQRCG
jgi:hypothetical protein